MKKNKRLSIAKKMPRLRHSTDAIIFDIKNSDSLNWILNQREVRQYLWDKIKASGDIIYNAETGTWQGVEWCDEK